MGKNSAIQWTDHTFNPWEGCTKVSPGCAHCYAEARNKRWAAGVNWGKGAPRRRTSLKNWMEPFKWDAEAGRAAAIVINGTTPAPTPRPRVFCASLADVFDDEVAIDWLGDLMDMIRLTVHLDWLLLTKRPQNIRPRLEALINPTTYPTQTELARVGARRQWLHEWMTLENAPRNVWLGTSVENQDAADERILKLLEVPAQIHFLSCEPLLGLVNKLPEGIDWVICGGESGAGARPMEEEWAYQLRLLCDAIGIAFFMKQMGGASDKRGDLEDIPERLRRREIP